MTTLRQALFRHSVPSIAVSMGACLLATPAGAQDAVLQEVIVSASKRDQAIIEVPMAIQAFSEQTMQEFGMDNFEEYAQYVPGLSFTKSGPNQSQVIIRGLSTDGEQGGSGGQPRSLVGIYLDDIPLQMSGNNFDPDLFDMARVEVLKGPQGTLFGDGAMAGAIRYVTAAPDLNGYSGRLNVRGSSTARRGGEGYSMRGMFNAPVSETIGVRAVGWYDDSDGYVRNVRTGDDNIGRTELFGGRVSALFQPTDTVSITARVLAQSTRQYGFLQADLRPELAPNDGFTQLRDPESYKDDSLMGSLTAEWDLGPGSITSVTGYLDRDFVRKDSTTEGLMIAYFGPEGDLPNDREIFDYKQEVLTQELRYTSTGERRVDYTAGVFFAKLKFAFPAYVASDGFDSFAVGSGDGQVPTLDDLYALGCPAPEFPADTSFCGSGEVTEQEQISGFADFTIHVTDRFDLLAGARYFDWKQDYDLDYRGYLNGGPVHKILSIAESGVNPRFGLSYEFGEGHRTFLNVAKGFRLGGANYPLPPACNEEVQERGLSNSIDKYESDSLWSYEAGVKLLLADRRVLFSSSVFYTKWDDVLTSTSITSCGYPVQVNSGKVESKGVEFDATIAATERLQLVLSGSYTDAKLAEDSPNLGAADGDRVPWVPTWKASALVSYTVPLAGAWSAFGNFSVNAADKYNTTFAASDPEREAIPASQVGALRLGVETDRYRISLFADNVWDEPMVLSSGRDYRRLPDGTRYVSRSYLRPRTVGLELNMEF